MISNDDDKWRYITVMIVDGDDDDDDKWWYITMVMVDDDDDRWRFMMMAHDKQ